MLMNQKAWTYLDVLEAHFKSPVAFFSFIIYNKTVQQIYRGPK